VFLASSSTPLWDSTGDGSANCVRKQGGQETFEWLCAHEGVVYLAQSENIKNCYTCFLKKFSDWTWDQEKRKGIREDPKYITCRRYKRKKARNGQEVCLYKGANDTYSLVVEGQCPIEYRCKKEDQQRYLVWFSALTVTAFIIVLMTPLVPIERIDHLSGIAEIWVLSNMGVLASFIGFNQLSKRGERNNEHIQK
jgi:hypothetical protein